MTIAVWAAESRFVTRAEGRTTYHSFSFGAHYDPARPGFADLVALNEELLPPGTGYDDHPHRATEIVTVVLAGQLRHRSALGEEILTAGEVQRLSSGSGVVHSEVNPADEETVFLQCWVRPDSEDPSPDYARATLPPSDGFVVAAGAGGALPLRNAQMRLHLARPAPDGTLPLPDCPRMWLHVALGEVQLGERVLTRGDAAELLREGGRRLRTGSDTTVLAVWTCDA